MTSTEMLRLANKIHGSIKEPQMQSVGSIIVGLTECAEADLMDLVCGQQMQVELKSRSIENWTAKAQSLIDRFRTYPECRARREGQG